MAPGNLDPRAHVCASSHKGVVQGSCRVARPRSLLHMTRRTPVKPTPRAPLAAFAALAVAVALALAPGSAAAAPLPAGSTAVLSGTPSLFDALPSPVGRADINPD